MPRLSMRSREGEEATYALDDHGQFVWLPDPDDPKVQRGIFVCDDDGNVLSEEKNIENVLRKLSELGDKD
ncbi:MAG: hypothetical protein JNJ70_16470 [Verrucomicrobiales bacterium]|nr:hypothetical protein [Verrucomicrobiales bacterium]